MCPLGTATEIYLPIYFTIKININDLIWAAEIIIPKSCCYSYIWLYLLLGYITVKLIFRFVFTFGLISFGGKLFENREIITILGLYR